MHLFHTSFPTIFPSIFISLVWGIWTPSKHGPWLLIVRYHIICPSYHFTIHCIHQHHVAFPPFTIPWLSLVIGPNHFILSIHFIHSILHSSNQFISIHSIHSYHIHSIYFFQYIQSNSFIYLLNQSLFNPSNLFTSNQYQFYYHYSSYPHHSSNLIHIHSSIHHKSKNQKTIFHYAINPNPINLILESCASILNQFINLS